MLRFICLVLAVLESLALATAATAQTRDGTYSGTIRCSAVSGTDIGPLAQAMSLTIAGTSLAGERLVGTSAQIGASGVVEKWTGRVTPDGSVSATSDSASARAPIQGTFRGKVTDGTLQLTGTQTFTSPRTGATSTRNCGFNAKR